MAMTNESLHEESGEAPRKPSRLAEVEQSIAAIAAGIARDGIAAIDRMIAAGAGVGIYEITPTMAAHLFVHHNKDRNRDLSVSKALYYADAMRKGEWKLTHQGLAFYADGNVGDGQHRLAATALSGQSQRFVVMAGVEDDIYDAIDVGKGRTAKDAIQLSGIEDASVKAAVMTAWMKYDARLRNGVSYSPTVIQVDRAVRADNALLERVIAVNRKLIEGCGSPVLSLSEASAIMFGLLKGGYPDQWATAFMSSVQVGVADYPEAPAVRLNEMYDRARKAASTAAKLSKEQKMALCFKGAALSALNKSINRIAFRAGKEPLPAPTPPEGWAWEGGAR